MNPALAATFTGVAQGLLQTFGREVRHEGAEDTLIFAVIREAQDALALSDPFPQRQWTAQVAKSAGVAPGDTLTHAGVVTADDPDPDDVVWRAEEVLSDDGFVVTLAIRQVTP